MQICRSVLDTSPSLHEGFSLVVQWRPLLHGYKSLQAQGLASSLHSSAPLVQSTPLELFLRAIRRFLAHNFACLALDQVLLLQSTGSLLFSTSKDCRFRQLSLGNLAGLHGAFLAFIG